jgi:hypothetical protein
MARLSDEEIEERLAGLRGWRREGEAIRREFELDDFEGVGRFREPSRPAGAGHEITTPTWRSRGTR